MNRHCLAISAVMLVVFVGAARAELNEAPLPSAQPPDTVAQPAQPPSAPVVGHRIQHPRRGASISLAHPSCTDVFACGQYRMVGIGF